MILGICAQIESSVRLLSKKPLEANNYFNMKLVLKTGLLIPPIHNRVDDLSPKSLR